MFATSLKARLRHRRGIRVGGRAGGFVARRGLTLRLEGTGWVLAAAALAALSLVAPSGGFALLELLAALGAALYGRTLIGRGRRYQAGARGERRVATVLRGLGARGIRVSHDVKRPGAGNVDHVAVGPHAAIAIETKLMRFYPSYLRQAEGHARWLAGQVPRGTPVVAVICLAFGHARPHRHGEVWVMGARHLRAFVSQVA